MVVALEARRLVELRDRWLNPPEWVEWVEDLARCESGGDTARPGSAAIPVHGVRRSVLVAAVMLALVAAPAAAQQSLDVGGRVYGLVGGGFGDGTFVATGAGAGLRLTRHLGLDVELTHLSGDAAGMPTHGYGGVSVSVSGTSAAAGAIMEDFPALPLGLDPWFPSVRIEDHQRDVTTFLTRFTVEFRSRMAGSSRI